MLIAPPAEETPKSSNILSEKIKSELISSSREPSWINLPSDSYEGQMHLMQIRANNKMNDKIPRGLFKFLHRQSANEPPKRLSAGSYPEVKEMNGQKWRVRRDEINFRARNPLKLGPYKYAYAFSERVGGCGGKERELRANSSGLSAPSGCAPRTLSKCV